MAMFLPFWSGHPPFIWRMFFKPYLTGLVTFIRKNMRWAVSCVRPGFGSDIVTFSLTFHNLYEIHQTSSLSILLVLICCITVIWLPLMVDWVSASYFYHFWYLVQFLVKVAYMWKFSHVKNFANSPYFISHENFRQSHALPYGSTKFFTRWKFSPMTCIVKLAKISTWRQTPRIRYLLASYLLSCNWCFPDFSHMLYWVIWFMEAGHVLQCMRTGMSAIQCRRFFMWLPKYAIKCMEEGGVLPVRSVETINAKSHDQKHPRHAWLASRLIYWSFANAPFWPKS